MSVGEDKAKKIKVVCHGCGARYQVSSTKVRGRRFRATCKRCGGIIVARCSDAFSVQPEDKAKAKARASGGGKTKKAKEAAPGRSWYVVISGKPHGPLSPDDLRQSFDARKISERSYIWKAGDGEWRRLEDVEEFADLLEETTNFYRVKDGDISDDVETVSGGGQGGEPEEEGHPAFRNAVTAFPDMDEDEEDVTEETTVHFNKQSKGELDEATQHRFPSEIEEPDGLFAGEGDPFAKTVGDPFAEAEDDPFASAEDEPFAGDGAEEDDHLAAPEHLPEPGGWGQPATEWGPADELWPSGPVISMRKAFLPMPTGRPRLLKLFVEALTPRRQPPPMPGAPLEVDDVSAVEILDPSSSAVEILPAEPGPPPAPAGLDALPLLPAPPPPAPPPMINVGQAAPVAVPAMAPATTMLTSGSSFWTKGKIAAAAAICGGVGVAAAVILGVYLARSQPSEPPKEVAAKQEAVSEPEEKEAPRKAPKKKVARAAPAPRAVAPPARAVAPPPEPKVPAEVKAALALPPAAEVQLKKPPPPPPPARVATVKKKKAPVRLVRKPAPRFKRRPTRRRRRASRSSSDVDSLLTGSSSRRKRKRRASSSGDGVDGILAAGSRRKRKRRASSSGDGVDGILAAGSRRKRKRRASSSGDGVDGVLAAGRRRSSGSLPRKPSKAQIRSTMRTALPRVRTCYDRYRKSGIIKVLVRVSPGGRADARVVGSFRGTSTAVCVLGGVSNLRFPRFSGPSFSFTYPFRLK